MNILTVPVGFIGTNCYIVTDEQTKKGIIIDPGAYSDKIIDALPQEYDFTHILITHPHYDHFNVAEEVKQHTGARIYVHENVTMVEDFTQTHLFAHINGKKISYDEKIKDGDIITVGSMQIKAIYTPGHSEASCCFILEDNIFCGDLLFYLNVGRTDLQTGSFEILLASLDKLKQLYDQKGDFKVYPGHGQATSLKFEIDNNPYMNGQYEWSI